MMRIHQALIFVIRTANKNNDIFSGKAVTLEFDMKDAKLYSFTFK